MKTRTLAFAFVASGLSTCAQRSLVDPSVVDEIRILAVRAEPPEVLPGSTPVRLEALVGDPSGRVMSVNIAWSWCEEPRVATDTTAIPSRCMAPDARLVVIAANDLVAMSTVPGDACTAVGPNPAPIGPMALAARAPDPDATGGYAIPGRLELDDRRGHDLAFAPVRITCPRRDVPSDVAAEYSAVRRPNANPAIDAVVRMDQGALDEADRNANGTVAGGEHVTIELETSADASETYARISVDGTRVEWAREQLEVAWFATGAHFETSRNAVVDGHSRNVLVVDGSVDVVTVWMVLRDGRGGTAWRSYEMARR